MYSNFINIIFEHYLPYYYDTTLTNYIPTYAKIYRILSEHVKSRKINRCDPCQIYCLVDEDETQNQVHFQGTLGSKVGCVFPMVVYLLSQTEFGSNHHREEAPHFIFRFTLGLPSYDWAEVLNSEPEHIKNQKIFDERMERSANKICQICNQEVINKVNYNGDLLPSTGKFLKLVGQVSFND